MQLKSCQNAESHSCSAKNCHGRRSTAPPEAIEEHSQTSALLVSSVAYWQTDLSDSDFYIPLLWKDALCTVV